MKRSFFVLLSFFLMTISLACRDDDSEGNMVVDLVGTWHQTSRVIDGSPMVKDSSLMLLDIKEYNICVVYDSTSAAVKAKTVISRSGWDFSGGLFNLAILMPASWNATLEGTDLSLERKDFKSDGAVSRTILKFQRVTSIND